MKFGDTLDEPLRSPTRTGWTNARRVVATDMYQSVLHTVSGVKPSIEPLEETRSVVLVVLVRGPGDQVCGLNQTRRFGVHEKRNLNQAIELSNPRPSRSPSGHERLDYFLVRRFVANYEGSMGVASKVKTVEKRIEATEELFMCQTIYIAPDV